MIKKNRIKLAVTGGIGSGKSTISNYIALKYGYHFIDADKVGHEILFNGDVILKLKELFGEKIFSDDLPDRKKIAAEVFKENRSITAFNRIVHPAILKNIELEIEKYEKVLVEAALLFEAGWETSFDASILVTCSEERRIKRVLKRDKRGREEIVAIIKKQIDAEEALCRTSYIIKNDFELKKTFSDTDRLIIEIEKRFLNET